MLSRNDMRDIIQIGILLTTEKDMNRLLSMILSKGMELTNCDAGTLYLCNGDSLDFNIMKTLSLNVSKGGYGEKIDLPSVPLNEENVCAYAAVHRELINIEDVYHSDRFDFKGTINYDNMTGYRTKSMLVVPMIDIDDAVIGVMQLINAMDGGKNIISFSEDMEFVLRSLGSQAAVAVSNMLYMEEVKCQMHSFVDAFAMAVDTRTPYNGSHTRKVTRYALLIADQINKLNREGKCADYFDENRREQLELSASVHDIGKMVVPLEIMNKSARLDGSMERIEDRYKLLQAYCEIDFLKGRITKKQYEDSMRELNDIWEMIKDLNGRGVLDDDAASKAGELKGKSYTTESGETIPYLTDYEIECLSIRKGTLTDEERREMENHVVMTNTILNKVHFNSHYSNVIRFASAHHEYLDGSGYPCGISGDELELEARILTVVDIYDALTSADRPYKTPMSSDKAFTILHDMAAEGKIEDRLVCILQEAVKEQNQIPGFDAAFGAK